MDGDDDLTGRLQWSRRLIGGKTEAAEMTTTAEAQLQWSPR